MRCAYCALRDSQTARVLNVVLKMDAVFQGGRAGQGRGRGSGAGTIRRCQCPGGRRGGGALIAARSRQYRRWPCGLRLGRDCPIVEIADKALDEPAEQ
jgi:hypothetical protein